MTEQFHYTTEAGDKIVLPKFANVPFGLVRRLRKESEDEQLFGMIEELADEQSLEAIDKLGMGEIEALFTAWQGETSLGESTASPTSS